MSFPWRKCCASTRVGGIEDASCNAIMLQKSRLAPNPGNRKNWSNPGNRTFDVMFTLLHCTCRWHHWNLDTQPDKFLQCLFSLSGNHAEKVGGRTSFCSTNLISRRTGCHILHGLKSAGNPGKPWNTLENGIRLGPATSQLEYPEGWSAFVFLNGSGPATSQGKCQRCIHHGTSAPFGGVGWRRSAVCGLQTTPMWLLHGNKCKRIWLEYELSWYELMTDTHKHSEHLGWFAPHRPSLP